MLKGKTKIILKNEETGEVEIFEDENIITNAVDKIININAGLNVPPNNYILPIANKLLGGIMLFDDTLTESVNNIHFPTEAHIVGWAGQDVNTNDKYRGSYNALESGFTTGTDDNGQTYCTYTSVWDFDTTQANGTIKAVARTSNYACETSPFFHYHSAEHYAINMGLPETDRSWMPIRYDGQYVYLLKGDASTHIMRMARVRQPLLRFGCADYSAMPKTYEIVASWNTLVAEVVWYASQANKDGNINPQTEYIYADDPYLYEDGQDGKIYCTFFGTARAYTTYNYNITYFTIQYDDESYTKSETTKLQSGLNYYAANSVANMYTPYRNWGHISHGNFFHCSQNRKIIYKVPLNNVAAYTATQIIDASSNDFITYLDRIASHNGGIYFSVYHYTTTGYNYLVGFLYPDGIFVLPDVSYGGTTDNHGQGYSYNIYGQVRTTDDDLTMWSDYREWDSDIVGWVANYLGTINNLASAVTKTAAQSLKIVYTLTDVNETES